MMARRIYVLAPCAVALAIFGCGGAGDSGLFGQSGVSGAGSAGALPTHGAGASSTPPADTSSAGDVGLGGQDAGGESAGESSSGGSDTGGGNGEAGHSGSVDHGGAGAGATAGAGTAGSAGSSAGAGGSSAGAGGSSAGAGGSSEPTCSELLAEAATELNAARACDLSVDAKQCTGTVDAVCNCQVPVDKDDSVATRAYEATLKQIDAKHCAPVCPAIACFHVTHAQCRASAPGSANGTCIARIGVPAF